jgi:hypothetical protein
MYFLNKLAIRILARFGQRNLDQGRAAGPDPGLDFMPLQNRQSCPRQRTVQYSGNVVGRIDEGSIQIEDDSVDRQILGDGCAHFFRRLLGAFNHREFFLAVRAVRSFRRR